MNRVKYAVMLFLLVLISSLTVTGCNFDYQKLFQTEDIQQELIKVELYFTDNQQMVAYIKGLGLDESEQVYVGGSSVKYLYDGDGNVIGAFNYQRLIYMKILTEDGNSDAE